MPSLSDYQQYLNFVQQKYAPAGSWQSQYDYADAQNSYAPSADWLQNPTGLFDTEYSPTTSRVGSPNPYLNTQVRDYVREVAKQHGMSDQDADIAALGAAQAHLQQSGQPYGDADHPMVVADSILKNLFGNAGQPYQGLTQEQITHYNNLAGDFQTNLKGQISDAENAQNLNEGLQIAGVFAGPALYASGAWAGGAAPPPAYADAAATGYGAPGFVGGDVLSYGSGTDNLLGGQGTDVLSGQNPYLDAGPGLNPGNTPLDPSLASYELGNQAGSLPAPAIPPTATPGLDLLGLGTGGGAGAGTAAGLGTLGTGLAGAGAASLLGGSGEDDTTSSGGGGSAADGLLGGLLGGSGSNVLGSLIGGGLGVAGATAQADAYHDIAQQSLNMGQPYRDMLAQLYADPTQFYNSQGVTQAVDLGTNALSRALSVKGNPIGNGGSLQQLQDRASQILYQKLSDEKQRLANFGGLSALTAAAPAAQMAGANAEGGAYNAAGWAAANLLNPNSNRNMWGLA